MYLYETGGQRWMYTCVYCMAVIAVWSQLESLLALERLIRAYSDSCLISWLEACFIASLRACLMSAWQSNAWELRLRDAYFGKSWVFHMMLLANENLWVCGRLDMNVDKLNLLVYVLLVLQSPSPTLSSLLSSPCPSYHCHHQYQPLTECAHLQPPSVGCGQHILLENLSSKI